MPTYDRSISSKDTSSWENPFQQIQRTLGITIGSDATDPEDQTSTVLPVATPMAPVCSGTDHTYGEWMPIRRSRVATVAAVTIVDDASPFKVGDYVHSYPLAGVTGAVGAMTSLGIITAVNYTTNAVTTANTGAGLAVNDFVEVCENGAVDGNALWRGDEDTLGGRRQIGLLKDASDSRINADGDVQIMTGEVVIEGSIREEDIHYPEDVSTEGVLSDSLQKRNPLSIHVIERPHI